MSPEFLAILEDREHVALWVILLPLCLGLLALIVSAVQVKKVLAFIGITLLALACFAIPTLIIGVWWTELSDAATSQEDREWLLNNDGGLMIWILYSAMVAAVSWFVAVLVLSIRSAGALIRHTKEKKASLAEQSV